MGPSREEMRQGRASGYPHQKSNTFEFFKVIIRQVCFIKGTSNSSDSNNVFNVNSNGNVNNNNANNTNNAVSPAVLIMMSKYS